MESLQVAPSMELKSKWAELKAENPKLRIREAAKQLNSSEAELLATGCGENITRLDVEFKKFLELEIPKLGRVMALTRNNEVVHERKGEYIHPGFNDESPVGLFVGEDIDLRIFLMHWKFTFAVKEMARGQERLSIQFFDKFGTALHKVYLIPESNQDAFTQISEEYKHATQSLESEVEPFELKLEKRNEAPATEQFQKEWLALEDTHDFFAMQRKHKLSRLQALELAPSHEGVEYAVKVDNDVIQKSLQKASEYNTPIMVFVGNKGMIQIHTGEVKKLLEIPDWYNVMDPNFNLHLKLSGIKECWIVKKPTSDGIVTSIEIFNHNEELVCTFFGKRKPGIPEDEAWRKIINELL